jgi:hypothetical protein
MNFLANIRYNHKKLNKSVKTRQYLEECVKI